MKTNSEVTKQNNSVLIIDDEVEILEMARIIFEGQWELYLAKNEEESIKILEQNEIGVVICDLIMPGINGIELLIKFKDKYPDVRRILFSGNLNLESSIESINLAEVHKIVKKPWKREEFINDINQQLDIFNSQRRMKINNSANHNNHKSNSNAQHRDEILELMINLSTFSKVQDLSNQFISAIEGMKSLAIINSEIYFEENQENTYNFILQHLSDIEVFANQYNQKILIMYLHLIRSYFALYRNEFKLAHQFYKACQNIFRWISSEYIETELLDYIKNFPVIENLVYEVENIEEKVNTSLIVKSDYKQTISELLNMEISKLVIISDTLFQDFFEGDTAAQYLIVVRDELPIYNKSKPDFDFDVGLISGFVVALSNFLQEVVKGSGDLDVIKHASGEIIFHKTNDLVYFLLTSRADTRYRIGLRQFAYEAESQLMNCPKGHLASGKVRHFVDNLSLKIFNL